VNEKVDSDVFFVVASLLRLLVLFVFLGLLILLVLFVLLFVALVFLRVRFLLLAVTIGLFLFFYVFFHIVEYNGVGSLVQSCITVSIDAIWLNSFTPSVVLVTF